MVAGSHHGSDIASHSWYHEEARCGDSDKTSLGSRAGGILGRGVMQSCSSFITAIQCLQRRAHALESALVHRAVSLISTRTVENATESQGPCKSWHVECGGREFSQTQCIACKAGGCKRERECDSGCTTRGVLPMFERGLVLPYVRTAPQQCKRCQHATCISRVLERIASALPTSIRCDPPPAQV
jgi:hypothetical protein